MVMGQLAKPAALQKKNHGNLLAATGEVVLEVNAEKIWSRSKC
jgi:hypothetical protein